MVSNSQESKPVKSDLNSQNSYFSEEINSMTRKDELI